MRDQITEFYNGLAPETKQVFDLGSIGIVVASVLSWIPAATAVLSFVWVAIRIYETPTVQSIIKRLRGK